MTSLVLTALAAASVAAGSTEVGQFAVDALPVGDYYRPTSEIATGFPNSTSPVPFRRSICPGMNALANHGYIPRDGREITHENLGAAMMSVFNFDNDLSQMLLDRVPTSFSLDITSHDAELDHDASLVREDKFFGLDPAFPSERLVNALMSHSHDDKTLGVTELGEARRDRLAECQAHNPECNFTSSQMNKAFFQAAIFIIAYGGDVSESVSVEDARTFVGEERIPYGYVKPVEPLTISYLQSISEKIQAAA